MSRATCAGRKRGFNTPRFGCIRIVASVVFWNQQISGCIDVANRRIHMNVSDDELAKRKAAWKPLPAHSDRGWVKLYCDTVLQADRGVDLDFLVGKSGAAVGKESH